MSEAEVESDHRLYRAVTAERTVTELRAELAKAQATANTNYEWADWLAQRIATETGTDLGESEGSDRWRRASRSIQGQHRQSTPRRSVWRWLRRKPLL